MDTVISFEHPKLAKSMPFERNWPQAKKGFKFFMLDGWEVHSHYARIPKLSFYAASEVSSDSLNNNIYRTMYLIHWSRKPPFISATYLSFKAQRCNVRPSKFYMLKHNRGIYHL